MSKNESKIKIVNKVKKIILPNRKNIKSFRPKNIGFNRAWYLLDASKYTLGRLATIVSILLIGKNRSDYTPDVDRGGVVVIKNCEKVNLTGKKSIFKTYMWHTGRPGGLKSRRFNEQLKIDPTKPLYNAIKGMLPKNRLQKERLNRRLKLISGDNLNYTQKFVDVNFK